VVRLNLEAEDIAELDMDWIHPWIGLRRGKGKGMIAPEAAAAAALYVTYRADVQPIVSRLSPHTRACSLPAKQPHAQLWSGV